MMTNQEEYVMYITYVGYSLIVMHYVINVDERDSRTKSVV